MLQLNSGGKLTIQRQAFVAIMVSTKPVLLLRFAQLDTNFQVAYSCVVVVRKRDLKLHPMHVGG